MSVSFLGLSKTSFNCPSLVGVRVLETVGGDMQLCLQEKEGGGTYRRKNGSIPEKVT